MRKLIYILFFVFGYTAYSQSLSVFNVDASAFPTIKANFIAFDSNGDPITNFSVSDFKITENGFPRTPTNVDCSNENTLNAVSVAISIDVSSSMSYDEHGYIPFDLAKITAKELANSIIMPPSEFALQICNSKALIVQDFTTDNAKYLSAIETISTSNENDFVEQLLNPLTGLLNIIKRGIYTHNVVLFTDAGWIGLTQSEIETCKDICVANKIKFYAVVYSSPETDKNGIKRSLQTLADATGGLLFDGITSAGAATALAKRLQTIIQDGKFCEIEWESGIFCKGDWTNVEITDSKHALTAQTRYEAPIRSGAALVINPPVVVFLNPTPGIKVDSTVSVFANNTDFTVTNVTCSNPDFSVIPQSFFLAKGQRRNLKIYYLPADSSYEFNVITFESDKCLSKLYVSGGFKGKKPKTKTINLMEPNGGEVFSVGADSLITWEGVMPDDPVKIEYSTNNGLKWTTITDSGTDFFYKWRIPKTPSTQCLARITANATTEISCDNSDVLICNQFWMGCNLNVAHYRNGDPIPQVSDPLEWRALTTGAWCYYNNDPKNGEIYGKLYNWYAVNDPRGLAPAGWYVPSDEEWTELENCIGGKDIAGGKLKSMGTIETGDGLWFSPNNGATNETGFAAVPGGYRYHVSDFLNIGVDAYFWTSTDFGSKTAYYRRIGTDASIIGRSTHYYENGFSVRCIRMK
ncbi:MAG: FISUMP domain-containing protein [bacterium]